MNALAALLTYAGLTMLALAMARHHRTVFRRDLTPHRRRILRAAGWLFLALSVTAAFRTHGAEIGAVAWFALAAGTGFALTLLLAYVPRFWPAPLAALLLLSLLT